MRNDQNKDIHVMFSPGGFDAKATRFGLPGTGEAIDMLVARAWDNPHKALVMKYVGRLVADGHAKWAMLDNGEVEVCFSSGETYVLAETTVIRIA